MANYKALVTATTPDVIAGLDLEGNGFKNIYDGDRTVIPGRA
jgi:hypothetical protein